MQVSETSPLMSLTPSGALNVLRARQIGKPGVLTVTHGPLPSSGHRP